MDSKFSEVRIIYTEVAMWCAYHPEDMAHRFEDPPDWPSYDFAVSKELAAGKLIAVGTGADSGFMVRFTNEGLTEREQRCVTMSQTFRLRVNHGCFFVDGELPSEWTSPPEDYPYECIHIPNGDYCVTVYALDYEKDVDNHDAEDYVKENKPPADASVSEITEDLNTVESSFDKKNKIFDKSDELIDEEELSKDSNTFEYSLDENHEFVDEEELSKDFEHSFDENDEFIDKDELSEDLNIVDYPPPYDQSYDENELPFHVVVFEIIEDLNTVECPTDIPTLRYYGETKHLSYSDAESESSGAEESKKLDLKLEYIGCPLLLRPEVFFPTVRQDLALTLDERECLEQIYGKNAYLAEVVVASRIQPQAIATIFWIDYYYYSYGVTSPGGEFKGGGSAIVKIKNIYELTPGIDSICWAVFEPYYPLPSTVDPILVEELKQRFALYAATDVDYQQRIKYHRFYAERVEALTEPQEIGYAIAHALNLPNQTKYELLKLDEAELIKELNDIFKCLF